jgi:hypothetical protein
MRKQAVASYSGYSPRRSSSALKADAVSSMSPRAIPIRAARFFHWLTTDVMSSATAWARDCVRS